MSDAENILQWCALKPICRITRILAALILMFSIGVHAMDDGQTMEFDRIMHLSTEELSTLVNGALNKYYPGED